MNPQNDREGTISAAARALAGHAPTGAQSNARGSINRAAVRRTRRDLILQGFSGPFQATGILLLGLTVCWAALFGDVFARYIELKDDRACKYLVPAGWLNPKVVESHIAGALNQMPFLLAWGLVSRLLALSETVTRCVESVRGSVNQFLLKILIFKTDLPWFLLSSHSGTLWHHVRMEKVPKCPQVFLNRLLVFSIYSTFFSILLFLVLSFCLGLLIRRAERQLAAERRGPLDALIGLLVTGRVRDGNAMARPTAKIDDQLAVNFDSNKFGSDDCHAFPPDCPICCVDFDDVEPIVQAVCGSAHVFHRDCLGRWFENSGTCPICRACLSVGGNEAAESIALEANSAMPATTIGNLQDATSQVDTSVPIGDSVVPTPPDIRPSQEMPTEVQTSEAQVTLQPARIALPGNPESSDSYVEPDARLSAEVVQPLGGPMEGELSSGFVHGTPDPAQHGHHMPDRSARRIGWSIRDE